MLIGLTGGIASGKSFVADLFRQKGCYTLDADEVSRILTAPDGSAYPRIVSTFGASILSDNGCIDRGKLRAIIIEDSSKKKLLEEITHPEIRKYSRKWYGQIKGRDDKAIGIYHAPLLIEANVYTDFDTVILIYASVETQLKRLKERGHPPMADALKLMNTQMPYEEKLKYAQHVINNDADKESTEQEVERVLNLLKLFRYTEKQNKKG